ncbi:MAG: RsmE family RNA methyltransferase [Kiritimatiellae bacterium]|nr:RsmE family RNA methyltransferase [Kiritimatiellia bacterium]
MSAPRCFADFEAPLPEELHLSAEEGRHLARVRRVGVGAPVSVLNGRGGVALGTVQRVDRQDVWLSLARSEQMPPPTPNITLMMGALKQTAWDLVLKHIVELGVNRIIRVQCERSVADVKSDREEKKRQRWNDCLIEACKQSGNPWLPILECADDVDDALKRVSESDFMLLAGLEGVVVPLSEALPVILPSPIVLWVGPEGDFTPKEQRRICAGGATAISLGDRILRAETAALALTSALRLR